MEKKLYFYFFKLLYNIVVVLAHTDVNQPWVYICPPLYFLLKQDKSDLFWLANNFTYVYFKQN